MVLKQETGTADLKYDHVSVQELSKPKCLIEALG
jgi:hypothetical protein